ncbi:L-histidine N(alpha)-methyltransferase [Pedobacter sp. P351]|uniref:L-histidine N(alpha)-methyltransferase n=1 Tax=Pedobacter superstes TaxID=3133441 RepID=UPI00309FD18C
MNHISQKDKHSETTETFKKDVIKGLRSTPKFLQSKYFYDKRGDKLFQKIMEAEQYYLTDAELEIFNTRCREMLEIVSDFEHGFDLVELGAGDALKSAELLKCLSNANIDFSYYPIDISGNIIQTIEKELPKKIKDLKIKGITGDYFDALEEVKAFSKNPKLLLLLGGNIGNMPPDDALIFCNKLHNHLKQGDKVLIGFDLKKNPWTIFNAYNDKDGITREFNLNLLHRINRELDADINVNQFEHYESYDPESGACKSYLFSLIAQTITIEGIDIHFEENECIFMETSQKYTIEETQVLAKKSGFKPLTQLFDSRNLFTDVVWERL